MNAFTALGLSPEVVKAVHDAGYDTPTPIQEQAIPVALTGRDVLGIAQTGTGKTAAFTLPMIDRLAAGRSRARMPRSLVLCPTRELADQVAAAFDKYAKGHKLNWALLIGGVSFDEQVKKLDRGVDVLIATPGRLLDLFERGRLLLTGVQIMVVDEADRMLDMGFIPDIERIFKLTPPNRQTLFFSATMPPEITRLTTQFLKDPTRIEATRPAMTADTIDQYLARIPSADPAAKRTALRALAERADVKNAIVFCNRKSEVDIVAKSLRKHGFDASPIHGDLDQSTRTRTLESFRKGELKFLVASDVAARGLDIPAVSHIFNYDVPHHAEDYVHRIGRTGRAGLKGQAFTIITPADARSLDKVLKLTKKAPDEVVLDIDWSQVREGGGDRSRERSRRPPSSRGEHRERPRADHGQRASMEPVAPGPAVPVEARAETRPEPAPVEPVVHAVVETSSPPARDSEPRNRGRSRGRGRDRDRAERPAEEPAATVEAQERPQREPREAREQREPREAREQREPREAREQREPREARGQREPREPREPRGAREAEAPRAAAPAEAPLEHGDARPDRSRGGVKAPQGYGEREDSNRVVGFGSDVPAFLRTIPGGR